MEKEDVNKNYHDCVTFIDILTNFPLTFIDIFPTFIDIFHTFIDIFHTFIDIFSKLMDTNG